MADNFTATSPTPPRLPDPAPKPELLRALGRLVRGLSALFWGLPIALVISVQTAKGDWLQPLGVLPPLATAALLVYALTLLGDFQKQERIWSAALERAKLLALLNLGLAPFLFWWRRFPANPFYNGMLELLAISALLFLYTLNPVLWRLAAMLPDETLRLETKLFTTLNRCLLLASTAMMLGYAVLTQMVKTWFVRRFGE